MFAAALLLTAASLGGHWSGTISTSEGLQPVEMEIGERSTLIVGSRLMRTPPQMLPISSSTENGHRVALSVNRGNTVETFKGQVVDDPAIRARIISGYLGKSKMDLVRVAAVPKDQLIKHAGLYRFSDGSQAMVYYLSEVRNLVMVDYPSGNVRILNPASASAFFTGPGLALSTPVARRIALEDNILKVTEGGRTRTAERLAFDCQEVSFSNGPIRLAGSLTRPKGPGRHPVVVLLHGSGPQDRDFGWVTNFFAARGVAVLSYDKRGVGASTGNWERATTSDLAGDALAAVDFLVSQPGIDRSRIGLYGSSNGGWSAPLAASFAPEKIAFLIVRSGSGLPERENIVWEIETDLRAAGYGDDVVAKMRELHRRDIALLWSSGEHWNEFRADVLEAAKEPWFPLIRIPGKLMEMNDENRTSIAHWISSARLNWADPAQFWTKVKAPTLVQIGSADGYVPAERSRDIIAAALAKGGNGRATVKLYPGGDHPMFENPSGKMSDLPKAKRFVPGYLTDLSNWIDQNVHHLKPALVGQAHR